jgi:hypothetical protein
MGECVSTRRGRQVALFTMTPAKTSTPLVTQGKNHPSLSSRAPPRTAPSDSNAPLATSRACGSSIMLRNSSSQSRSKHGSAGREHPTPQRAYRRPHSWPGSSSRPARRTGCRCSPRPGGLGFLPDGQAAPASDRQTVVRQALSAACAAHAGVDGSISTEVPTSARTIRTRALRSVPALSCGRPSQGRPDVPERMATGRCLDRQATYNTSGFAFAFHELIVEARFGDGVTKRLKVREGGNVLTRRRVKTPAPGGAVPILISPSGDRAVLDWNDVARHGDGTGLSWV